ncbi:MAG: T9SS type A sorting domain-containing protein [Saprospiraceae bacterium]|nr:T9SS type A sorting domain-containing protein [Saprospiraceae bacterium]
MKNLFFFLIALFMGLFQGQLAAQCTTSAGTMTPGNLDECVGTSFSVLLHNEDEVLDANDVLKLVVHDGTATTLGNVLQFYSTQWQAFILDTPPGAVPGVTYQIAAIAGNPDGNGGVDLNDPCLSFSGGVTVTFHAPQVVTVNDAVIGCNEFDATLNLNITPPGSYEILWSSPGLPTNAASVTVYSAGWYDVLVRDLVSGCWAADTAHVTVETGKPYVSIDQLSGSGCGQANVVVNVNGQGPHSYLWEDGSTDPTRILLPGTHCVSVTSANGCVGKDCIVVEEPGNLTAAIFFAQFEDCGQSYLAVEASSSANIVSYQWSSGTIGNTDSNFSSGENYVTVTDASGCEAVASYFVENAPTQCGTLNLRLFYDLDNNCLFNGNDYRLENFKILVKTNDNLVVFYGNTYDYLNGFSWTGKLNPGDYIVSVELPNSAWQGCQASYPVTISPGIATELNLPLQAVEPCAILYTDLSISELNWCSPNNYASLIYQNFGTAPANNAYIELQLEDHITINSSSLPFSDLGNNLYRFDLGTLGVAEKSYIYLAFKVDCSATMGATPCLTATIFPNEPCPIAINANWTGASLRVTSQCDGGDVKFVIENVGTAAMAQPLDYVIIEDAVMFMQVPNDPPLPQGGTKEITLPANGSTWRIEVAQEALHPGQSMPALALEGCDQFGSQGFVNLFPPDDADDFVDIECVTISGPYDPNDKEGLPLGVGEDHLIRPGTDIEYMIRFQNTGNDTAETVVIRDTLDQWLDPMSIEPGAASHPYRFDYFGEGGQIKFIFENIMLLDSNLNEPASHGYVKFRIKHRTGIPLGTDIHNRAAIYFDYNPPIFTNTTHHRIGEVFILESTSEPSFQSVSLVVKPNPMENEAIIAVQGLDLTADFQATLFDALGRPVKTLVQNGTGFGFEREGLAAGIYFVRVSKNGAPVASAKLMVK